MTRRVYHEDAYQRRFDAVVVAHATYRDQPALVLDQTAFYPEAGGQLGDRGTLAGLVVRDTQELDDGSIVHLVDGELPSIGAQVSGELDWARRRQRMAQHTAQHLLSGTLLDRAHAPTASARLGETALTIDVAGKNHQRKQQRWGVGPIEGRSVPPQCCSSHGRQVVRPVGEVCLALRCQSARGIEEGEVTSRSLSQAVGHCRPNW